jgi:hypothetical protein
MHVYVHVNCFFFLLMSIMTCIATTVPAYF